MKSELERFSAARATESEFPPSWPLDLNLLQPFERLPSVGGGLGIILKDEVYSDINRTSAVRKRSPFLVRFLHLKIWIVLPRQARDTRKGIVL